MEEWISGISKVISQKIPNNVLEILEKSVE